MRTELACVVGLGHVGLPLAVWWAEQPGARVVGVDHDKRVLFRIRQSRVGPEPELAERLAAVLDAGQLTVASGPPTGVSVVAVCVPTPLTADRQADLSAVWEVVEQVLPRAVPGALWLVLSTVPVGTTEALARRIRSADPLARVAMCPERVWPGQALHEIVTNARVVGGVDVESTESAVRWFTDRCEGPVLPTTAAMAELTKLVENASRDAAIAVAHAAGELALHHGLDPFAMQTIVNTHPRVALPRPGVGIGGHCLPVDPWFLNAVGTPAGELFAAVRTFADGLPDRWVARILAAHPPPVRVAVLGVAYKPQVADLRASPALALARGLARHAEVVVHDPFAEVPSDLQAVSLDEALRAEVVVHAVAHDAYRGLAHRATPGWIDACGGWSDRT